MVLHSLTFDNFILVVPFKSQRVFTVRTFELDLFYFLKIGHNINLCKFGPLDAAKLLNRKTVKYKSNPVF